MNNKKGFITSEGFLANLDEEEELHGVEEELVHVAEYEQPVQDKEVSAVEKGKSLHESLLKESENAFEKFYYKTFFNPTSYPMSSDKVGIPPGSRSIIGAVMSTVEPTVEGVTFIGPDGTPQDSTIKAKTLNPESWPFAKRGERTDAENRIFVSGSKKVRPSTKHVFGDGKSSIKASFDEIRKAQDDEVTGYLARAKRKKEEKVANTTAQVQEKGIGIIGGMVEDLFKHEYLIFDPNKIIITGINEGESLADFTYEDRKYTLQLIQVEYRER